MPRQAPEKPTRIAHITDPHTTDLTGSGPQALTGKRLLGYLSWLRKRRKRHTQRMLEATTAAALDHRPDALVLTGDLLHVGLASEMRQIRPWLAALAKRLPVLLVPGNHDLYRAASITHWQQELGDLPVFGDPLSDRSFWPRILRVNTDVELIGLNSAYPAPLTKADGLLGPGQLERLRAAFNQPTRPPQRILALHHPAEPTLSKPRKMLRDAEALQQVLSAHPVTALLHGHLHENLDYEVQGVPCYCTASASSVHAPALASFRLFELERGQPMNSQLFVATDQTGRHFASVS